MLRMSFFPFFFIWQRDWFQLVFLFLQSVSGTNVIGILEGQFFNTANDEVVILGAHLDTRGILHEGVNNDGSGLAALISLAEDLTGKYYVQGKNASYIR